MHDPKLIDEQEPRIPDEWRRMYEQRPIRQLPSDVIKAFDLLHQRQRQADRTDAKLIAAEKRLGWARIWILILTAAIVAQWGLMLLLIEKLMH